MPSSFSVVPRRAGTWNSCLISKAVLYLKYVYLYIIILHELGVESHLSAAGSPPRIFLEEIGNGWSESPACAKTAPSFFGVFPQIVVASADSTIVAELHAVGPKGQKKLPAQVIVVFKTP